MLKTKHLVLILIPAVLVAGFALFIQIMKYLPTSSLVKDEEAKQIDELESKMVFIFPSDQIIGDKKAPIELIVFDDLACSACAEQDKILNELVEKHPDKVKIIWKGLPITQFPRSSRPAHQYLFCATQQNKFLEFKQLAYTNWANLSAGTLIALAEKTELDTDKLNTCLQSGEADAYIKLTESLAQTVNIQTVPTFFINDTQIKAPNSLEGWEAFLQL